MRIRHATPADTPAIIAMSARFLLNSAYGAMFNEATPETIGRFVETVLEHGVIFLAETVPPALCFPSNGEPPSAAALEASTPVIVGMLAGVVVPHPLTGLVYADELAWWVNPESRGGLAGPKMLRSFEEWARQNGANMVKMVAPAGSAVGDYFEHVGYRVIESTFVKVF